MGKFSKEELAAGAKYLVLLKELFVSAMVFFLARISFSTPVSGLIAALFLSGLLLLHKTHSHYILHFCTSKVNQVRNDYLIYFLLGIDFFLSSSQPVFRFINPLIFLYGFPTGSIAYHRKGTVKSVIFPALAFVVTSIALFLLF